MPGIAHETSSRHSIQAIVAAQDSAWADGDAVAFSAPMHPDVVFTNVVGMFSVGRVPFEAQHARIFATFYKGSRLKQLIQLIAFIRPDIAIVDTLTEVTEFSALPPGTEAVDGVLRTRLEQVMVCNNGQWTIASFHNVVVNPHGFPGDAPVFDS